MKFWAILHQLLQREAAAALHWADSEIRTRGVWIWGNHGRTTHIYCTHTHTYAHTHSSTLVYCVLRHVSRGPLRVYLRVRPMLKSAFWSGCILCVFCTLTSRAIIESSIFRKAYLWPHAGRSGPLLNSYHSADFITVWTTWERVIKCHLLQIQTFSKMFFLFSLQWEPVQYFNNKIICDLVEEKFKGIISILVRIFSEHEVIAVMCYLNLTQFIVLPLDNFLWLF